MPGWIKRLICLICVVIIAAGSLCSCSDNAEKESDQATMSEEEKEIFKREDREFKLGLRFDPNSRYIEVFSHIQAVTKDGYRFKISYKISQSQSEAMLGMKLPYGKAVELLEDCDAINTGGNFAKLAENGLLMDITDLLPKYAPSYYTKLTEAELELVTYNGRIYGIPPHMPGMSRYCVMVQSDVAKELGITEIKDLEDYGRLLALIKSNIPELVPVDEDSFIRSYKSLLIYLSGYVDPTDEMCIVYKYDDPEMKLVPFEQTTEYRELADLIKAWYEKGYIGESKKGYDDMAKICVPLYEAIYIINMTQTPWKIYPLYPDRPSIKYPSMENIIGISAKSEKAEDVLRFIEWVHSSQENYDLFMYGIEGKDYTIENGRLKRLQYNSHMGDPAFWDIDYMRDETGFSKDFLTQVKYISGLEEVLSPTYELDLTEVVRSSSTFITNPNGVAVQSRLFYLPSVFSPRTISTPDYLSYTLEKLEKESCTDFMTHALQAAIDNWRKKKAEAEKQGE